MKTTKILTLLLMLCCIACGKKEMADSKDVVIITTNPSLKKVLIGSGLDIKTLQPLNIETSKEQDTLVVPIHKYKRLYVRTERSAPIKIVSTEKDTLLINTNEDKIAYSFTNRVLKKYDTLPLITPFKQLQKEENQFLTNQKRFFEKDSLTGQSKPKVAYITANPKLFREYYLSFEAYIKKQNTVMKQLVDKDSISEPIFQDYTSSNNIKLFRELLFCYDVSKDDYYKEKLQSAYLQNNIMIDDYFLSYGYVNELVLKLPLLEKENIDIYNRKFPRFSYAFDSLPKFVSGDILKHAQFYCLSEIAKKADSTQFNTYLAKYKNSISKVDKEQLTLVDSLVSSFDNNQRKIKKSRTDSGFVQLTDYDGNKTTLKDVIDRNKGNLIYIDFWASWCLPCREEMPASKKLMETYKDKNITFIYISTDQDANKWKAAAEKENLISNNSFLANNYPNIDYYKALDIMSIPRYILYDKKGMIINPYELRPSNTAYLGKKFDELLLD